MYTSLIVVLQDVMVSLPIIQDQIHALHVSESNYLPKIRWRFFMSRGTKKNIAWPVDCAWPKPVAPMSLGSVWDVEDVELMELDEAAKDLLAIRAYMDELVSEGRLNEDYSLNDEYEAVWGRENIRNNLDSSRDVYAAADDDDPENMFDELEDFAPELGEDYWDDGFDIEAWQMDLLDHINLLKIDPTDLDSVSMVREMTGYDFINENLLRQAFTRRAFAMEHGLGGDSEELEFLGDAALHTVLTREIAERFLRVNIDSTDAPLLPKNEKVDEGTLSRAREQFSNQEFLASRARHLGLGSLILYGNGEQETESALEDALEALIGAVAVDCSWDWDVIADVVDRLLVLQLDCPDRFLKQSYYELFNAWHQKHFGVMPDYTLTGGARGASEEHRYSCSIRFRVPENDSGVNVNQRVDAEAAGRSRARELAAEMAYWFVLRHGLWIRLEDAHVEPKLEDAINQLQELYQKKYVENAPEYSFEELHGDQWACTCICGGVHALGMAGSKTAAKKNASFKVLVKLLDAAGCCREEWKDEMWRL